MTKIFRHPFHLVNARIEGHLPTVKLLDADGQLLVEDSINSLGNLDSLVDKLNALVDKRNRNDSPYNLTELLTEHGYSGLHIAADVISHTMPGEGVPGRITRAIR